jgi:uncharacterized RDD family membrane protein YckC
MTFDDTKTVITPEEVAVTYRLAGIGTRFAAVLVDTFIHVVLLVGLVVALGYIFPLVEETISWLEWEASSWMLAVTLLAAFAVFWGYFMFWETVWNGRTPGKKLAGIRVIRDTGHPVDFRTAFLRNIVRYVDFLPASYGVGTVVMFLSQESKRLGDYVAGTIVVVDAPRLAKPEQTQERAAGQRSLLGDLALLNLRALNRDQLLVVDRFLERRGNLPEGARAQLARQIAEPLMAALGLEADSPTYSYEEFLEQLAAAYRQRDEMRASR